MSPKPDENQTKIKRQDFLLLNQKLHGLFMRTKKIQGGPADKARGKRAKILLQTCKNWF